MKSFMVARRVSDDDEVVNVHNQAVTDELTHLQLSFNVKRAMLPHIDAAFCL